MNSKKLFIVLLSSLFLIFAGSIAITVYSVKIFSKSGEELMNSKTEEAILKNDIKELKKAKLDLKKYLELDKVARAIVPQEKDQARTVREIIALANESKIGIDSIKFPESTLGQKLPPKSKSTNKSRSTMPEGSTQIMEIEGLKGVYVMPIDVVVGEDNATTYSQLIDFLSRLEKNRRTSHINSLSIDNSEKDSKLIEFSIQINAYIKP